MPVDSERQLVPEWDALAVSLGFDYELYQVETEDLWTLTLFRITGNTLDASKPPLLFMHGESMDAHTWMAAQSLSGKPLPLILAEEGYDVWMGNNRGTKYSNVNPTWPDADDFSRFRLIDSINPSPVVVDNSAQEADYAAKYDFDWFDMGLKDLPTIMDCIQELNTEKLVYIGYSLGNAQLTYALT